MEIIFVDDGSTDKSRELCEEFCNSYRNAIIYHKENGGPSSARNLGLNKAKGKYIAFADVDDYVYPSYIEYLWKLIQKKNVDMSVCACMKMTEGEEYSKYEGQEEKGVLFLNTDEAVKEFCYRRAISGYCYLKLIKADIAKSIVFPEEIVYGEDYIYIYEVLKKCKKVIVGKKIQYIYIQHKESSTHKKRDNTQKYKLAWKKHLEILEDVKKQYPDAYRGILAKCYILAINNTTRLFDRRRDEDFLIELESFVNKHAKEIFKDSSGKWSNRLLGLLGMLSTKWTCKLCDCFFKIQNGLDLTLRHTI